jgi:hypothetical protein
LHPAKDATAWRISSRSRISRMSFTESSGFITAIRSSGRSCSSTNRSSASRARRVLAPALT